MDKSVENLLALMTTTEKVGQLNLYNGTWDFTGPVPQDNSTQERADNIKKGLVGGMLNVLTVDAIREAQEMAVEESRLGIPMIFGYDVVHGYKTMMPIPLAQTASWDSDVAYETNRIAAIEAASSGLNWAFAPMIDVSRDGRWGRIMEGGGEDPYLTSVMAVAWIRGFQQDDLSDPLTMAACAKHFAAYGFAEAGRDYNTTDVSDQTLFNIVLPPFKAAVEAGVVSVMNGFNDLNGVPVTADGRLQRDILKGDWGFEGFVVSDFNSVGELVTHGFVKDEKAAARAAFMAGSDMEMDSRQYERHLNALVDEGAIDMAMLDDAVRRILKVKFELGLFEDPYRYCNKERATSNVLTADHLAAARDAARKTMVLLKNDNDLLPIAKDVASIAVIGQLAAHKDIPLGSWRAQAPANSAVSVLEGIREVATGEVTYTEGYRLVEEKRHFIHEVPFSEQNRNGFSDAIQIARQAEVVVMVIGEDCFQSGEGRSQVDTQLKGNQVELLAEIVKVNPNVIVVLMNGRPVVIPDVVNIVPAVLESWFGGSASGNAIADVLFGDYNPSGKLPVSFPYHTGQEPLYYNHKNGGRPVTNDFDAGKVFWSHYTDAPNEPLFPFGFGLSYSIFSYNDLTLSSHQLRSGEELKASVNVTNKSNMNGEEVVQLYIRDLYGSTTRPVKELKAFEKVMIRAGETRTITFKISTDDLAYYWPDGRYCAEEGDFHIFIGGNSRDVLQAEFELL